MTDPPSHRTKVLAFVGFVLLVATITFFALLWLDPFEDYQTDNKSNVPSSTSSSSLVPAKSKPSLHAHTLIPPLESKSIEVGPPRFEKSPRGWQVKLSATRPTKFKHFVLREPPRLVIDVYEADYTGEFTSENNPTPFIAKLRVGKQKQSIRFVLDFSTPTIPTYEAKLSANNITIVFSNH
jgi:hypothetical protein